ncbi:MAG: WecB/TagA/CpsF family glycosyltransferase [Candidatus Humimicrobiaceae bacterium]|jgi:N-acetylglucosaminyldiphosphoundecaprenol N-acetyl-beta-D-mannosaminyltransferase|nr:WecB/TagA/CpsF family glycosyltransferase [Candidatus Humimicrobiaceae bacterium]
MDDSKVKILKLKINNGCLKNVIELVQRLIDNNEKFYVCVPNAYLTVKANEDKELLKIINNAKIAIPDGMPLVWYSKTFNKDNKLSERIDGSRFFLEVSKIANKNSYSYFFLGGDSNEILEKIKQRVNCEFENIEVKGYFCPPFMDTFTDEIDNEIIKIVNNCNPDILWVGLSAPKQEKWIYKNIDKLNIKMACGIGAVFNFYSGVVKKAPEWMQKAGLEWLYRIYAEPGRLFKKYMIYNTKFTILVLKDLLKRGFKLKW